MKLISAAASPFARKVRVLLHECALSSQVEVLDTRTSPIATDPELRTANPLGKIPALLRTEGAALYDSRVICRFVDTLGGAAMYPASRLWDVLTLEATADGLLDAAVLVVYEGRCRPLEHQDAGWREAQWGKVAQALAALESRWMAHLRGPLDMGHIAVGCALGYLDFRHAARGWREGHNALAQWYQGFAARPSMVRTTPKD